MMRDRGAESFPLVGISDRGVARRANHASGAGCDREPALLEREHGNLKSLAFFTDEVPLRHAHVLERKISGIARADAELAVNRARGETGHRALDNETRHAGV